MDDEQNEIIFVEENLSALKFTTPHSAFDKLNQAAFNSGFALASKYTISTPYPYFSCTKGGHSSPNHPSNKTGCTFFIKLRPVERGNIDSGFLISKFNLNHIGHEPNARLFTHLTLSEDITDVIIGLYNSGASPSIIKKYLFNSNRTDITSEQIQKIVKKPQIETFGSQSNELITFMESIGGHYLVYDETLRDKTQRLAVFTMTQQEENNFRNFCDVIFMDATCVPLRLEWQLIPLTLIGPDKSLHCGGILFCAVVTVDIVYWLINRLYEFEEYREYFKTIITDDDNAFFQATSAAFDGLFQTKRNLVYHVLCANHKRDNILNKAL
jgi:hypothetical protein